MKKFTLQNFLRKMQDPEERKYFYALFGGKLLGVAMCFVVMLGISAYIGSSAMKAHAQTDATNAAPAAAATAATAAATGTNAVAAAAPAAPAPAVPDPPYVNPINTMWVLITAFLVFFMQA